MTRDQRSPAEVQSEALLEGDVYDFVQAAQQLARLLPSLMPDQPGLRTACANLDTRAGKLSLRLLDRRLRRAGR